MRTRVIVRLLAAVSAAVLVCISTGCRRTGGQAVEDESAPLPNYTALLNRDPDVGWIPVEDDEAYDQPLNLYIDNTGSMQAFIFDETYGNNPDPQYVRFMRSLRDFGKLYDSHYYVIQQNEQTGGIRNWAEYNSSVYGHFSEPEFYFSWEPNSDDGNVNGPLSLLYLDQGTLNPDRINIVITDLAEQNVNNTHLAAEIQRMCEEHQCTAYLYAFRFDYHGEAQVPNPDKISDIAKQRVDGPRPYYMIVTGPAKYMEKVTENMKERFAAEQLEEDRDYYVVSNRLEAHPKSLKPEDLYFEPSATLDEIKQELKSGQSELSRNLVRQDQTDNLFQEPVPGRPVIYRYEKIKGLKKSEKNWKLYFYVPLYDQSDPLVEYKWTASLYYVKETEEATERGETADTEDQTADAEDQTADAEDQTADTEDQTADAEDPKADAEDQTANMTLGEVNPKMEWAEESEPTAVLNMEEMDALPPNGTASGWHFCISGIEDCDRPRKNLMMILNIRRYDKIPFDMPEWIADFDTGSTDDYFQRTYNLEGFYDVLFGYQGKRTADNCIQISTRYTELPIIITDIK